MTVRASALPSSSGSYNSAAHAPLCTHSVKLAGACRGSLFSPARKLLRLNFVTSSFIELCMALRSPTFPGARFPSKTDNFGTSLDTLRSCPLHLHTAEFRLGAANLEGFGFQDKSLVQAWSRSICRNAPYCGRSVITFAWSERRSPKAAN